MVAAADDFVAEALDQVGPGAAGRRRARSSPTSSGPVELCLDRDPGAGPRVTGCCCRCSPPCTKAARTRCWQLGSRVLERWPDARRAVAGRGARGAGHRRRHRRSARRRAGRWRTRRRRSGGQPRRDRARRASVGAGRPRRRSRAPPRATSSRRPTAAEPSGSRRWRSRCSVLEPASSTSPATAATALDAARRRAPRGAASADDVFVTVLAHLVRAVCCCGPATSPTPQPSRRRRGGVVAQMGQPWWTAAMLRTRRPSPRFGPDGWAGLDAPVAARRVDFAASRGAARRGRHHAAHGGVGRPAPRRARAGRRAVRRRAAVVGDHGAARAVPGGDWPSSQAHAPARPAGTHLVDALARARAALDAGRRPRRRPNLDSDASPTARAELAVEGDSWRVVFNGRPARVRDMKGIGDLAVLLARPGVEVHALELMGGPDVGGTAGPAPRRPGPPRLPGTHRRAAARHRRGARRQRPGPGRAGRGRARRPRRAAQRGVRARAAARAPPDRAPSGPARPSRTASARRSASSTNSIPSSAATWPTPSAPARGARTSPEPRCPGRSSAAALTV